MKTIHILILSLCCITVRGQQNYIFDTERVHSVQLITAGDPLQPPVINLKSNKQFELGFDIDGHDYHRLIYRIYHCTWDWQKDEDLFTSDYLRGLDEQPLDEYETSFNTTQLYTHFSFIFPNRDVGMLLSGNYCIEIYDDDNYGSNRDSQPLLRAEFCLVEPLMSVSAVISANTDIDFNASHQQVTYSVAYGALNVADPLREIHTVVKQNRRDDNAVIDLPPNIRKVNGIEFTHRKELIFPATNEFRKFEIIDMHRPNLNVDYMRWYTPYYHFTLFADRPQRNYLYDEDADGAFILRNAEYNDVETTSEYAFVHFTLQTGDRLPGGDLYVCGLWTNGTWDPQCLMQWDDANKEYRADILLKQGYYNYQYRQRGSDDVGTTNLTDGNFYETENQYSIFVYYKQFGSRYDRLVAYSNIKTTN